MFLVKVKIEANLFQIVADTPSEPEHSIADNLDSHMYCVKVRYLYKFKTVFYKDFDLFIYQIDIKTSTQST